MSLVLGIDGGGSSLRAALAPATRGPLLGRASAGAGNARSVPEAELARRLTAVVGEVLAHGRGEDVAAVVAGFAGAAGPEQPVDAGRDVAGRALGAALAQHGVRARAVRIVPDIEIAFACAPGTPADGVTMVAGTGAAGARIRGHRLVAASDGCGWLAGDDGSGFWIAREGLRRALRALDGRGPATVLTEQFVEVFAESAPRGESPRLVLVDGGLSLTSPVRLARHCPVVVRAARDGDEVAGAILDEAADLLAESTRALGPLPGEPLVTVGGLLGPEGPLLARFEARVSGMGLSPLPVSDGLEGAVVLARLALGSGWTPDGGS
ncbi:ATPase [Streptomyces sp. AJS327]|uniref:N-acetylglucosamine kinase n=1 Tax=Streptomyces sp. AJS327 TaxID=2545265 RepID=UPI0015DFC006|nr:BadF/BadG/BcrA/BcrD ATPase family protein [Streptomyces sp. AJS327]MBA0049957.1 ATPase [Streptomyces sp. AJS327]